MPWATINAMHMCITSHKRKHWSHTKNCIKKKKSKLPSRFDNKNIKLSRVLEAKTRKEETQIVSKQSNIKPAANVHNLIYFKVILLWAAVGLNKCLIQGMSRLTREFLFALGHHQCNANVYNLTQKKALAPYKKCIKKKKSKLPYSFDNKNIKLCHVIETKTSE